MMAMVEAYEVLALIYSPTDEKFHLSICYAAGKTITKTYDKYEYAVKAKGPAQDAQEWDIDDIVEDITADIEESVLPMIETGRILNHDTEEMPTL